MKEGPSRSHFAPEGWHTVTPRIVVNDAERFVEFIRQAGVFGMSKSDDAMSPSLQARMQGKTCFNFKSHDAALFKELEQLTVKALAAFRKAGFASTANPRSK